jgi:hypothetical protein
MQGGCRANGGGALGQVLDACGGDYTAQQRGPLRDEQCIIAMRQVASPGSQGSRAGRRCGVGSCQSFLGGVELFQSDLGSDLAEGFQLG